MGFHIKNRYYFKLCSLKFVFAQKYLLSCSVFWQYFRIGILLEK